LYCFIKGVSETLFVFSDAKSGDFLKFARKIKSNPRRLKVIRPLLINNMNRKLKLWELDRLSEEEFRKQAKFPLILVLDGIRSLNNIGSFFRTADAFNVEKIYLCGITAQPPHRDIQKTALGATETVEWEYRSSIVELTQELKSQGMVVCAIEQAEKTTLLQQTGALNGEKFVLVFGNEVDGVDQRVVDLADQIIEVPQFGTKHSLNVSVCAGVVLWEFAKRYISE
jgi:tRNA G18 (ribose-2'-O)-methylase SpoU